MASRHCNNLGKYVFFFEKRLAAYYKWHGYFVASHPAPFIVIPILLSFIFVIASFFPIKIIDVNYLYTPTNARSVYERSVLEYYWPTESGSYQPGKAVSEFRQCQVIAIAKNQTLNSELKNLAYVDQIDRLDDMPANILDEQYADAVYDLNKFIIDNVAVYYKGQRYIYGDLCMKTADGICYLNEQIAYANAKFFHNQTLNQLLYPTTTQGVRSTYFGSSLGGVATTNNPDPYDFDSIKTGGVVSAKAWLLIYQLDFDTPEKNIMSGMWEQVFRQAVTNYKSPYIYITYMHSQSLSEELDKNADALLPRFTVTFIVMIAFSILCTVRLIKNKFYADWILSKPTLGLMGVLNAGMGVISSMGLLAMARYEYNSIVAVMPFLVIATGVDTMFIMVSAFWRTDRKLPVPKRVSEALEEAGVAVTITAITNFLGFSTGSITTIPADRIFCTYTFVAVAFTFIYTMTFFLGWLSLFAYVERYERHSSLLTKVHDSTELDNLDMLQKCLFLGTKVVHRRTRPVKNEPVMIEGEVDTMPVPPTKLKERETPTAEAEKSHFFERYYGKAIMHPVGQIVVLCLLAIYLGVAIDGCSNVKQGLRPEKLLLSDSEIVPHYKALQKYFWPYGQDFQVVVANPPNLSYVENRDAMLRMAQEFANTKYTLNLDGVQFWLIDFMKFLTDKTLIALLPKQGFAWQFTPLLTEEFLTLNTVRRWRGDIIFNNVTNTNSTDSIKAFRFSVGLRHYYDGELQRQAMVAMRQIADKYRAWNVTTYGVFWPYADQYQLVLPNTLQNIIIELGVMIPVAFLLIPDPIVSVFVALAIISIDVGVVGYMSLWNVNLDAISMITITMSIGFSVDYTAHISFGYVSSRRATAKEKACEAIGAVGWPILQGAGSTILGVVALATLDAYIIMTFFKTVFLVLVLGIVHGIVFLPVLLSIFGPKGLIHTTILALLRTCRSRNVVADHSAATPQTLAT